VAGSGDGLEGAGKFGREGAGEFWREGKET
jgi:hypothetical protein